VTSRPGRILASRTVLLGSLDLDGGQSGFSPTSSPSPVSSSGADGRAPRVSVVSAPSRPHPWLPSSPGVVEGPRSPPGTTSRSAWGCVTPPSFPSFPSSRRGGRETPGFRRSTRRTHRGRETCLTTPTGTTHTPSPEERVDGRPEALAHSGEIWNTVLDSIRASPPGSGRVLGYRRPPVEHRHGGLVPISFADVAADGVGEPQGGSRPGTSIHRARRPRPASRAVPRADRRATARTGDPRLARSSRPLLPADRSRRPRMSGTITSTDDRPTSSCLPTSFARRSTSPSRCPETRIGWQNSTAVASGIAARVLTQSESSPTDSGLADGYAPSVRKVNQQSEDTVASVG
jgi:hypothetical protein